MGRLAYPKSFIYFYGMVWGNGNACDRKGTLNNNKIFKIVNLKGV